MGGSSAKAASKSSPAGGLDRIWLGLHPRNKGGCRAPLSREEGAGGGAALGPVGDLDGGRSGIWAPFLPCPPRPQAMTSHLPVEDRVFPGWGEMVGGEGALGCTGEGVSSPAARES